MRTYFLAIYTLWQREVVRFFRQKSRVIGAVAPPLVFWFLIGSGLDSSFHVAPSSGGLDYFRFFFPGTVLLIVSGLCLVLGLVLRSEFKNED